MYSKADIKWRDIFRFMSCLSPGPKQDLRLIKLKIQCIRSLFILYHVRELSPIFRYSQYFIERDNNLDLWNLSMQVKRRSRSLNRISLYLFLLQFLLFWNDFFGGFLILRWGSLWNFFIFRLLLYHFLSGLNLGRLTSWGLTLWNPPRRRNSHTSVS